MDVQECYNSSYAARSFNLDSEHIQKTKETERRDRTDMEQNG